MCKNTCASNFYEAVNGIAGLLSGAAVTASLAVQDILCLLYHSVIFSAAEITVVFACAATLLILLARLLIQSGSAYRGSTSYKKRSAAKGFSNFDYISYAQALVFFKRFP